MQINKVAPVNIFHLTYKYNINWHTVDEKSLNIDEQITLACGVRVEACGTRLSASGFCQRARLFLTSGFN
jgi:hypothetical protein